MPVRQPTAAEQQQREAYLSLLPDWLRPERIADPSVFDPWYRRPVREIAQFVGAEEPQRLMTNLTAGQMPIAGAMDTGPAQGVALRALENLAERYPGVAYFFNRFKQGMPPPRGTLAATVAPEESLILRPNLGQTMRYGVKPDVAARMAHFYGAGAERFADWDNTIHQLTESMGGNRELAQQWARLWGAVSPGKTPVPTSTREALAVWARYLRDPTKPMTVEEARTLYPRNITMAKTKVSNINAALAGERLSGEKAEAMSGFMVGERRIPFDVHTIHGAGGTTKEAAFTKEMPDLKRIFTEAEGIPYKRDPRTGQGGMTVQEVYQRYEDPVIDIIEAMDPAKTFHNVFGQTWEGFRRVKGRAQQGGPLDLMRMKGLLQYEAMLDPDRIIKALTTSGWTKKAIGILMADAARRVAGQAPLAKEEEPDETPKGPTVGKLYQ